MFKIYTLSLVFKTPNEDGRLLDFRSKKDDIIYAIKSFNNQYAKNRLLKLCDIQKQSILLLLSIDINSYSGKIIARALSYFSKRLHRDKNWKQYSREDTKLFTASEFNNSAEVYENTFEEIPEIDERITNLIIDSENTPIIIDENINISDEDVLKNT